LMSSIGTTTTRNAPPKSECLPAVERGNYTPVDPAEPASRLA